ncbi:MAG: hypothetical protein DRI80_11300, partial [Chloroflexota bacterium]
MNVDIQQWVEQLTRIRTELRATERGCLLIVATSDADLERDLAQVLAEAADGRVERYTFDPTYPSLAAYLGTLPSDPPRVVLALGLDDLPAESRLRALDYLNMEREALRRAGHSALLFIRPDTMQYLIHRAGDLWAWRSGVYEFLAPPDEVLRREALARLRLSLPAPLETLRRRYLDYIAAAYRWLDLRGLMQVRNLVRVPLARIYVPLAATVEEREPPFPPPEMVEERALPPEAMRRLREPVTRRVELAQALREHPRLVVLGDPGSGKSTFLKYLALAFAEGPEATRERLGLDEVRLPILIPLNEYALALREEPDLSPTDFLPRYFRRLGLPDLGPLLSRVLERGQAALLLDGLDEVASPEERRALAVMVRQLAAAYPRNRFVVTSRIAGYGAAPLGGDFATLTIAPFEQEDIRRFAHRWSLAYETAGREGEPPPPIVQRAEERAEDLIRAITGHPAIERLATNPLLLTILALIHYQGTRLPGQRVELYRLCVEALAETWNLARSLSGRPIDLWLGERRLDEQRVVGLLAPVAFWMHEQRAGGLVERGEL